MIKLYDSGAYLLNGTEIIVDDANASALLQQKVGTAPSKEEAAENTIAYGILKNHNTTEDMQHMKIRFDTLASQRAPIPLHFTCYHTKLRGKSQALSMPK